MAPMSQAQEAIRDYSSLPDAPMPSSWTTAQEAGPGAQSPTPFSFNNEQTFVAREVGG